MNDIFTNAQIIDKIQKKLPYLFTIAEKDTSRGGRVGMEVGVLRERIIISMLRYFFGKDNVNDNIPTTASEIDVILMQNPISIKTKTSKFLTGVKATWTVDWTKVKEFINTYEPSIDMLFVQIVWNTNDGGLFFIPVNVQKKIFHDLGEKYFKIPPKNTNPRGIEFSKDTMQKILNDKETRHIKIKWSKPKIDINVYEKWDAFWKKD